MMNFSQHFNNSGAKKQSKFQANQLKNMLSQDSMKGMFDDQLLSSADCSPLKQPQARFKPVTGSFSQNNSAIKQRRDSNINRSHMRKVSSVYFDISNISQDQDPNVSRAI